MNCCVLDPTSTSAPAPSYLARKTASVPLADRYPTLVPGTNAIAVTSGYLRVASSGVDAVVYRLENALFRLVALTCLSVLRSIACTTGDVVVLTLAKLGLHLFVARSHHPPLAPQSVSFSHWVEQVPFFALPGSAPTQDPATWPGQLVSSSQTGVGPVKTPMGPSGDAQIDTTYATLPLTLRPWIWFG